jgi:hypothetical protein
MASISANERASDDSLPAREGEPAPMSPLALLSSVATSWENTNHTMASLRKSGIDHSMDIAMSDSGLS